MIEIWVDGCLIELLDPDRACVRRERFTLAAGKAHLPLMDAASA